MYTIKKLGIESLDSILNLEKLCFPAPDRWKEEDWRMLLERDRDVYYAMTDGDKLIGNVFICNWLGVRDYVKVMNVSVHPDYRKQGIARRLLNRVTEAMTKLGMYRFCGETRSTNKAMQQTFEKCGYKLDRVEEHYFHDPDESAWKYVLNIPDPSAKTDI